MWRNSRTPIGPMATDALACLTPAIRAADGMRRADATQTLAGAAFDEATARDILEELRLNGYLYDVNGLLYVTPVE